MDVEAIMHCYGSISWENGHEWTAYTFIEGMARSDPILYMYVILLFCKKL